jgi:hypothetical protein
MSGEALCAMSSQASSSRASVSLGGEDFSPSPAPRRVLEASIPANNLKQFAHAISCLAKVGKEMQLEASGGQLVLRTLNDSRTAFVALYFNEEFFESFRCSPSLLQRRPQPPESSAEDSGEQDEGSEQERTVTCKVLLRAVHNVFKGLRKVHRMVVALDDVEEGNIEPRLVFQMHCDFDIKKSHNFLIQDCEVSHAVFDVDKTSMIDSSTRLLLQNMLNHMKAAAEVAAVVSANELRFKSHHDQLQQAGERGVLKTEMRIPSKDFEAFNFIGHGAPEQEMIFSLKEVRSRRRGRKITLSTSASLLTPHSLLAQMRAFLTFCEAVGVENVQLRFSQGGKPILITGGSNIFSMELMMATMGTADDVPGVMDGESPMELGQEDSQGGDDLPSFANKVRAGEAHMSKRQRQLEDD